MIIGVKYAIFSLKTMNTKKLAYLLVFSLLLGVSSHAYGAEEEDNRYLVKSRSGFWKKSFGVRHEFDDGFTTDMTDWQLRVAKVFNVDVVPVKKLDILVEALIVPEIEIVIKETLDEPMPSVSVRPLPASHIPWGVRAVYNYESSLKSTSGGADVNVAVLDTGVLVSHRDLVRRVKHCMDFTDAKQPVIDGKCEDKNGHGTHVTGIIAADAGEDSKGIYGVAPEANIFAYKVCGTNGTCWSDDIAKAIQIATDNGVNIINLSFGGDSESSLMDLAISYAVSKNVLIVAPAGNDGPKLGSIDYPAANPNVIAVGAFDVEFDIADWSSRGLNSITTRGVVEVGDVEFSAPGVIIESTGRDGGYVILSGTSMAAPHISGFAAKFWQKDAEEPDTETRVLIKRFTQDLSPFGEDDVSGFGFPHL